MYPFFVSMKIFLGYDHGGYPIRDAVIEHLQEAGHEVVDLGNKELVPDDDYPDFAYAVSMKVLATPGSRGLLFCRSGGGVCIAANKVKGIRAGLAGTVMEATESIRADDANILCVGANAHHILDILAIIDAYLEHSFEGGRHLRRKEKVLAIENGTYHA